MHDVAKIQNYQHVINTIDVPADWMAQLSTCLLYTSDAADE